MVDPVYQLNEDNWLLFYNETVARPNIFPLPLENWAFSPSLQSEAELLAVYVDSPNGQDSWSFGGFLNIEFSTGLTVGGSTDAKSNTVRKLKLNEIQLFPIQKFSSSYGIEFSIPYWIPDINAYIWEYTGQVVYPNMQLLQEINAKV